MVRIKHTNHPIDVRVPLESESLVSNETLEASALQKEASVEVTMSQSVEVSSDCGSQFDDSEEMESTSDDSERMKVAAVIATTRITFDLGISGVGKARITSMENNDCYFPKGYYRPSGAESVPEPWANEVVVFEDFFIARLCMPPHPILADILHTFQV
jgi:hypothetical protein